MTLQLNQWLKQQKLILSDIPMPPSENRAYWARPYRDKRTGAPKACIAPSRELTEYQKKDFLAWRYESNIQLASCRKKIKEWMAMSYLIRVDSFICENRTKLFNLKNMPKKYDVKNRLKPMHDCLAEALQIDDSYFWSGYDEKIITNKEPFVFVILRPFKPRKINELPRDLEGYC